MTVAPTPTGYEASRIFSDRMLEQIRERLATVVPTGAVAVTFGSYARREASTASDLDHSLIFPDGQPISDLECDERIKEVILSVVPTNPAAGGAFGISVPKSSLVSNLGGDADSNKNLTRRMLLLLEGEWLVNEEAFDALRLEILDRYVRATPKDHQLALFLLNDVIRYWRTMTVDYAYKTSESETPKPKAIRNIKLVFSRKLMYAGGLFAVGMTADRTTSDKVETLHRLFRMPVVERLQDICGRERLAVAFKSYDAFLDAIGEQSTRDHLNGLEGEWQDDSTFRKLKNEAHRFTRELMAAFEGTFHATHPIRRAVMF